MSEVKQLIKEAIQEEREEKNSYLIPGIFIGWALGLFIFKAISWLAQ